MVIFLTIYACALLGDVFLQPGSEICLSTCAAHTPVVHQQEGLVVVVQGAGGVMAWGVQDIVPCRKAPLQKEKTSYSSVSLLKINFARVLEACNWWILSVCFSGLAKCN